MDILRTFKIVDKDVDINIQGTVEKPLFQANQIGDLLEITNIRTSIRHFEDHEKVIVNINTAGGKQNVLFLTEDGLYRLLQNSTKPVAKLFQTWVANVIKELRMTGKYQVNNNISSEVEELQNKLKEVYLEKDLNNHKTLVKAFNEKRVIYFTKLKDFDETRFILKLGWTNDIAERMRSMTTRFGSSTLLDVFECHCNSEFELFLKRHNDIKQFAFNDEIIPGEKSTEAYLVTKDEYKNIIKIVKKNVKTYEGFDKAEYIKMKELEFGMKKLEMLEKLQQNNSFDKDLLAKYLDAFCKNDGEPSNVNLSDDIDSTENNEETDSDVENIDNMLRNLKGKSRTKTNTVHKRIQKYDPVSLDLIKTYEGFMDVLREHSEYSICGLKYAIANNTPYPPNGFRWYMIENSAEIKKYDIPPTEELKRNSSIPKFVAVIDKDTKKIVTVYASQVEAQKGFDLRRKQTINECIQKGRLYKNKYYIRYFENCEDELKNEYLARAELPPRVLSKGTKVNQIDIQSKQVIKTFNSILDVTKEMNVSRSTVKTHCDNGEEMKGYLWKYFDEE